jgi:hypothetical protein
MRKCKHENADHPMPGECLVNWNDLGRIKAALCEQFRCIDCGAWLSLGESNDEPEQVRVEMEAARLAAHVHYDDFPDDEPEDEWADYGWASHATDCDVYDGTWHGYLARCIATHTNEDA